LNQLLLITIKTEKLSYGINDVVIDPSPASGGHLAATDAGDSANSRFFNGTAYDKTDADDFCRMHTVPVHCTTGHS